MSIVRSVESESFICRIGQAIANYIGFGEEPDPIVPTGRTAAPRPVRAERPQLTVVKRQPSSRAHALRRHPKLRTEPQRFVTPAERSANHDALRGMSAAKSGSLEVALRHWRKAVATDDLDLTAIPGFWDLTRGQMMIAVDAYEQAGKYQEAALLDEQLSSMFRPTLVGTAIRPARSRSQQRRAAN